MKKRKVKTIFWLIKISSINLKLRASSHIVHEFGLSEVERCSSELATLKGKSSKEPKMVEICSDQPHAQYEVGEGCFWFR